MKGFDQPDSTPPEEGDKEHIFATGRMNPPTIGHAALVDKVLELAAAKKAGHSIVLSHSQDPEKNPLTP